MSKSYLCVHPESGQDYIIGPHANFAEAKEEADAIKCVMVAQWHGKKTEPEAGDSTWKTVTLGFAFGFVVGLIIF